MAKDDEKMEGPVVTIEDYVTSEKVEAFCAAYEPAVSEYDADEVWSEARVRQWFSAYVEKTHGDTLPIYLQLLRGKGHQMKVGASGELVLMLRYKRVESADICAMLNGNDADDDEREA